MITTYSLKDDRKLTYERENDLLYAKKTGYTMHTLQLTAYTTYLEGTLHNINNIKERLHNTHTMEGRLHNTHIK